MKRTEKTDKILAKYKQYLKLEKSLSTNTVDAYLTDLDKLLAYLTLENINILDVRLENLEDFSAGLHDIGIHPRSQARIISGIKSFYRFLFLDDYITTDPTELLESPKIGLKLPEVLTVNEINSILDTIDLTLPEGNGTGRCSKSCIAADCACRSWFHYASRMFISTKDSSRWKGKEANSGWFLFHRAPSRKSGSTSPTVT